MGVMVVGDCLGFEDSAGTLDNGNPWSSRDCVVLVGLSTVKVKVNKISDAEPVRGDRVAYEVEGRGRASGAVRYTALRRAFEYEAV